MTILRIFTAVIAVLLAGGEVARWWGQERFLPLAFDELLVAAGLLWAAVAGHRIGLTAAWGAFCGFTLSLLVPTLDHLLYGPPKESAGFYAAVLGAMLTAGVLALAAALRLTRAPSPAR
jgi:hypothetical protein